MKKLIICAAALATALFAGSCQKENFEQADGGNTVTYTVEVPGVATKAIGDATNVNQLIYEVWRTGSAEDTTLEPTPADAAEPRTELLYQKKVAVENRVATFEVDLVKDQNYTILFWAQVVDGDELSASSAYYVTTDLRNVTLKEGAVYGAFDEQRAAFYGIDFIEAGKQKAQQKVTLTRPFAQVNLGTVERNAQAMGYDLTVAHTSVTIKGASKKFNVATGVASAETADCANLTFASKAPFMDPVEKLNGTYEWIAMNYIFVPANQATLAVDYTITTNHGVVSNSISNLPTQKNYRTNIVGNLLTSKTDYTVELSKDWGTEDTDYEYVVLDGITYISIATAKDLQYFANQVNAGDPEWINANVLLANDIDLSELAQTRSTTANWTPISMSTDLANGKTYRGIFNGNGKSIKNMVCEGTEVAGLFGYLYSATIKNVTIENATINSNHFAAGIVAWVNNLKGNIQMPFVIENCHVVNSTITSIPEQVNGEWDNGDKVGGLVGAAWFKQGSELNEGTKIANSSVDNTTIKAYRDFGGLVGYAEGVNIENCSTNGVTLKQDLTHDYKAPDTPTTFGSTIGKNAGDNTIDGNVYVADGVTTDVKGNYHILNAAGLKWVSENVNTMEFYVNQAVNIFDNKTVYIENDIDFQGAEWRPIGDYAFSRTSFNGVFDGQNHTISNFKVTNPVSWTEKVTEASYGFFGNVKGTVQNLTIKNATVNPEGGRYSAALVGRLHNGGRIDNCHVEGSSVTINHWQVGGIVGQNNNGNISNCSVTGSTITGKAAVGAIVGMDMVAGEHTISDCSVSNSALVQNESFGASYDASYGLAVGLANDSGIILHLNNVVVENNTIKGVAANTLVGDAEEGAKVYVNGSIPVTTAEELAAAIKAGGEYILMNDVAMTESIAISNANFVLDGNGKTITMTADATNTYALFDITGGKAAFKNVTFDGVKSGAVVRTVGVEFDAENVTAKNGQHTQQQGLFRLVGKSTLTNCKFLNNTCKMVVSFCYDINDDIYPLAVNGCVFKSNICSDTAVLYYANRIGCTVKDSKFVSNTVNTNGNAATAYIGFMENCVITGNEFSNNHVTTTSTTTKRATGGLMIGYEAVITGNAFVGNTITAEGRTLGNDVCASVYYTDIDLSGNYWGGNAPVENDDYFVEYPDRHIVIVNNYLTENPIK